ncbi:MAG TPA: trypsin-like peptidase domain-containing protein [Candidatus Saccharimonadales bacterium]|jgi:serine protease Do
MANKDKKGEELSKVSTKPSSNKTLTLTIPTLKKPNIKLPSTKKGKVILVIVVLLIASLGSGFLGGWLQSNNNQIVLGNTSLGTQKQIVTSDSQLITDIAKTVGPSVVSVNVAITTSSGSGTSGSSDTDGFGLYGFSQPEEEEAAGTGIIISSNGIILTNRHVVPVGTTSVSITLSNGTELKDVSVIGRTPQTDSLDIAFLKINNAEGQKLVPAAIGDSSQMQVGDEVVAIGNALGQFQNTVTSGIISGYGRSVTATADTGGVGSSTGDTENLEDLFQTDAAINEGNSGGPLVNLNGQVIGVDTAIASDAQNIGFAIPINDVKGLINQVLKTGKFSVPYLGIRYIPLTADVANEYNLSVNNGAFIAPSSNSSEPSIISGSPADGKLQVNDIITAVNGTSIDQEHSLTSLLDQFTPGTTVNLTVIRNSKTIQVSVDLGTEPSS